MNSQFREEECLIFLGKVFDGLKKKKINVSNFELDHLCYRVDSFAGYRREKEKLSKLGAKLIESVVGGRKISTFELFKPLVFNDRKIKIIELPEPKENNKYREGFEHGEFVIDLSFQNFSKLYSYISFDWSGTFKKLNPELRLKLGDNLSVKFHHLPLTKVIEIEQQ